MKKTAWVAGASGLIGGLLIEQLVKREEYERIIAFVRTPLAASSDKPWLKSPKVEQWPVDFDNLECPSFSESVDDLFCALGSTTKKTPDKDEYFKVDVTYPLNFADLGLKHGATYYGLVSSHGADISSLSFYLRMKGELEEHLKARSYPHLTFARPSLLKGERKEFRLLEKFSEGIMSLMPGNYKAIAASDVAAALIRSANDHPEGLVTLTSKSMQKASQHD